MYKRQVLDLCDKMGILVIDELFDVWQCSKEGVNNESFNEWHERDVVNLCPVSYTHLDVYKRQHQAMEAPFCLQFARHSGI